MFSVCKFVFLFFVCSFFLDWCYRLVYFFIWKVDHLNGQEIAFVVYEMAKIFSYCNQESQPFLRVIALICLT